MTIARQIGRTIRRLREATGRSLADVADDAALSRTTLHSIEQGDANPTLSTLWALAAALNVPLTRLIDDTAPTTTVVRADQGPTTQHDAVRARLLHRLPVTGWVELYELDITDTTQHCAPHRPGVEECLIVTDGHVHTGPTTGPTTLGPGDSIHFDGAHPHVYAGPGRAVLLMVHR